MLLLLNSLIFFSTFFISSFFSILFSYDLMTLPKIKNLHLIIIQILITRFMMVIFFYCDTEDRLIWFFSKPLRNGRQNRSQPTTWFEGLHSVFLVLYVFFLILMLFWPPILVFVSFTIFSIWFILVFGVLLLRAWLLPHYLCWVYWLFSWSLQSNWKDIYFLIAHH